MVGQVGDVAAGRQDVDDRDRLEQELPDRGRDLLADDSHDDLGDRALHLGRDPRRSRACLRDDASLFAKRDREHLLLGLERGLALEQLLGAAGLRLLPRRLGLGLCLLVGRFGAVVLGLALAVTPEAVPHKPQGNPAVDDESAIRDVTRKILVRHGYNVVTAVDGVDGLAVFAQQAGKIDLLLTDIMMPRMEGMAMIRALKNSIPRFELSPPAGWPISRTTRSGWRN